MHKRNSNDGSRFKKWTLLLLSSLIGAQGYAQSGISLDRLDQFDSPAKSWTIVGDVSASLKDNNVLKEKSGTGILANLPTKKQQGKDLITKETYGDIDLELEYLMAKGSNSGIYLQGMYEIQLADSWGSGKPKSGDNGGIYERWDDSKPDGQKGYQGYAPRQNATKAPGLWQKLKVSFQAPKFDNEGNKIANARMLRVELNGVLIHENVELLGPTRGAMYDKELAKGPIRIQGDHGPVAFRNIRITTFDSPKPEIYDLQYELFEGTFQELPDFNNLTPAATGNSPTLTGNIRSKSKQFLIRYTGKIRVQEPGTYQLALQSAGGGGGVSINGKPVITPGQDNGRGSVELTAGEHPIEVVYAKIQDWVSPALGLTLSGQGLRPVSYGQQANSGRGTTDPILVDPREQPVLRSFMDLPGRNRVTHAISVGSEAGVHYTYDLDHGNLVQVWRGGFLDATPMWNSRGDGSSRPTGAVHHLGEPAFALGKLDNQNAAWVSDSTGTGFQPKGYKVMGAPNHLAFQYKIHGAQVTDELELLSNGQGLKRTIAVQGAPADLQLRLAQGDAISETEAGWYLIDDKVYYLQVTGGKPEIRQVNGKSELVLPVKGQITYSLLF